VMVCGTGSERDSHGEFFAGNDALLEDSSVCVVDVAGRIVREAKGASELDALAA
jgi:hypothetical protein